jgi:hypothetical protein
MSSQDIYKHMIAARIEMRDVTSLGGACAALLERRIERVYMQAPGYSDKATTLFTLDLGSPQELPDNLRGESWLFVQLPLGLLLEELKAVETRKTFGAVFSLEVAGLGDLPSDTLIPGVSQCVLHSLILYSAVCGLMMQVLSVRLFPQKGGQLRC